MQKLDHFTFGTRWATTAERLVPQGQKKRKRAKLIETERVKPHKID